MKTKSPITKDKNGIVRWEQCNETDSYMATGVDRDGKRFVKTAKEWKWIAGINLWRGTKWLVRDGKRYVISKHYN